MSKNKIDFNHLSESELQALFEKTLQEKKDLESDRIAIDRQMLKSKQRTLDLFGKMIDIKKAQKIIISQNVELEEKNTEIIRQKEAAEHTFKKFRKRTIELFGKMIDLKKAYKVIQQQKSEIEIQRKVLNETIASKDRFFSILAHDLKNPIAGFLGLTEMMARKNELSAETQQTFAESMYDSSKHLYDLLENLLHWARSQTGSLQIYLQEIDLGKLLDAVISQVAVNANLKNITIQKQTNISTQLFADEDTLITILRNLISNAIKYSKPNSVIDILVSQNENDATISIKDFGVGIAPELLDKLFNIDQTISQTGTANETGTGLGLILCKEFIELNGGTINVESELGKGSTFSVTVPLSK